MLWGVGDPQPRYQKKKFKRVILHFDLDKFSYNFSKFQLLFLHLDFRYIPIHNVFSLLLIFTIFYFFRFIVLRRIFLLVGIHYYYRALTMYVTALPKPNEQYQCAPKTGNDTTPFIIFQRVLKLLSGMGLSINGKHVYCGDYIYSGHTMTLIMTYLVIKECEYSKKKSLKNALV